MDGAAYEYVAKRYGAEMDFGTIDGTATTTVSEVLGNDPDRFSFIFTNLSTDDIYLKPRNNVSTTNGIKVAANGGTLIVDVESDSILPALSWFVVSTGSNSAYMVLYTKKAF